MRVYIAKKTRKYKELYIVNVYFGDQQGMAGKERSQAKFHFDIDIHHYQYDEDSFHEMILKNPFWFRYS